MCSNVLILGLIILAIIIITITITTRQTSFEGVMFDADGINATGSGASDVAYTTSDIGMDGIGTNIASLQEIKIRDWSNPWSAPSWTNIYPKMGPTVPTGERMQIYSSSMGEELKRLPLVGPYAHDPQMMITSINPSDVMKEQ